MKQTRNPYAELAVDKTMTEAIRDRLTLYSIQTYLYIIQKSFKKGSNPSDLPIPLVLAQQRKTNDFVSVPFIVV